MKKRILIILAVVVALAVPLTVFAATSDAPAAKAVRGFFGIDASKLTDQQKADVNGYAQQMAQLQKDFINKMVQDGVMTQGQANAAIARIDNALKNGGAGLLPGLGAGRGGSAVRKMPGGPGMAKIDLSKLTDQQKADLAAVFKQMTDLEKNLVGKMVSDGLMTQAQGDAVSKKIDTMAGSLQANSLPKSVMSMIGGFNWFAVGRIDTSKLTDQQKSDLTSFSQQMTALQKQVIGLLVTDNVLTQQQADTMNQKLDNMEKAREQNGFSNGFGMGKGQMGKGRMGRGRFGNPGSWNNPSQSAPGQGSSTQTGSGSTI